MSHPRAFPVARCGLSLLEMIIALMLFLVVIGAVFQSGIAATSHARIIDSRTQIQEDIARTRQTLLTEMRHTGRMMKYDENSGGPDDELTVFSPLPEDRKKIGYSRQLSYFRMRSSRRVHEDPLQERDVYTDMAHHSVKAFDAVTRYDDTNKIFTAGDVPPSPFFILNPKWARLNIGWQISPVWESPTVGLSFAENAGSNPAGSPDEQFLRSYRFILAPAPNATLETYPETAFTVLNPGQVPLRRTGVLLLQYRNPGKPWRDLGDPLARMVQVDDFDFANNTTDPTLNVTEIRLHMTVHRPLMATGALWPTLAEPVDIHASTQCIVYGD